MTTIVAQRRVWWVSFLVLGMLSVTTVDQLYSRRAIAASTSPAIRTPLPSALIDQRLPLSATALVNSVAQLPAASQLPSDSQPDSTMAPAPSRLWLIAMPAVPILGGLFIYFSRRLAGKPPGNCRLVTSMPPSPETATPEERLPQPEATDELDTDRD